MRAPEISTDAPGANAAGPSAVSASQDADDVGRPARPSSREVDRELDARFAVFPADGAMAARARAHAWDETPLGPVAEWGPALRTAAGIALAGGVPTLLVWGLDRTALFNDAFAAALGPAARDAFGRPMSAGLAALWPHGCDACDRAVNGVSVAVDYGPSAHRVGPDGASSTAGGGLPRHFTLWHVPVREADGRVGGVMIQLIDTAAAAGAHATQASERSAREEAERARHEAEEANRAKGDFLAVMSHEIRTPINAIVGYAQLLDLGLAGALTDPQRTYVHRLEHSSRHLLGLVNDVLDLSRADAGELHVARESRATNGTVAQAVDMVRPQAAARGVTLLDATGPGAGDPYVGDEHRVRQILVNLLGNAVKFTEAGGTITVRSRLEAAEPPGSALQGGGPWTVIDVEDTGVGLAAEQIAVVFEPFQQAESGHTRKAGGTGLGLTISRRLAQLMGGDVTVESRPGAGSTFSLWLPAAGAEETAATRGMRATGELRLPARGVGELGELLRRDLEAVADAYDAQLRADPGMPQARHMSRAALEDHMLAFVADLAQTLVIVGDAGDGASTLLHDSSAISRTIAQAHGVRRHTQGWSAEALARDYQVLRDVLDRVLHDRVGPAAAASPTATDAAYEALRRQVDAAAAEALKAWAAANERAGPDPAKTAR